MKPTVDIPSQEWPADFWQAFEGVPADFERPESRTRQALSVGDQPDFRGATPAPSDPSS
jgi:hypothetical protein